MNDSCRNSPSSVSCVATSYPLLPLAPSRRFHNQCWVLLPLLGCVLGLRCGCGGWLVVGLGGWACYVLGRLLQLLLRRLEKLGRVITCNWIAYRVGGSRICIAGAASTGLLVSHDVCTMWQLWIQVAHIPPIFCPPSRALCVGGVWSTRDTDTHIHHIHHRGHTHIAHTRC